MASGSSKPVSTFEEAAAYLEGLINLERRPSFAYKRLGLEPIRRLLERLGHPERDLSIVHVAGSKGKGSSCLFAEAILEAAGERVGTFTSPHLERWSERFRVASREVDGALLSAAVERLRPHVDALRREDPATAPTFFDATTAAALILFREAGVSRVLLEVGLGGRLDSTNAVTPAVTCITSIELEHTDKLGETRAAIASEKAGILKTGIPCVCGRLGQEAETVVRERAAQLATPLYRLGEDFSVEPDTPVEAGGAPLLCQRFRYRESDGFEVEVELPVLGTHQLQNASLALAATRRLAAHSDDLLADAARRGLARVRLPGRVELLARRPWVLVDAAHTAASARALASVLGEFAAARRHLVLSVSADKDLRAILEALLPHADMLWLTRAEPVRSLDPERLEQVARSVAPRLASRIVPDPDKAVRAARESLSRDDILCCAGSIYLAGIARAALRRDSS